MQSFGVSLMTAPAANIFQYWKDMILIHLLAARNTAL